MYVPKTRNAKRYALIAVAILIAQTTTTSASTNIDLTPLIGILTSILPLILVIMIIGMMFKLLGGLFEGLGSMFRFARLRASRARLASLASLALLVAQTTTTTTPSTIDLSSAVNLTTGIVYAILPVIIVFVVLGFVLKLVGKIPEMVKI